MRIATSCLHTGHAGKQQEDYVIQLQTFDCINSSSGREEEALMLSSPKDLSIANCLIHWTKGQRQLIAHPVSLV